MNFPDLSIPQRFIELMCGDSTPYWQVLPDIKGDEGAKLSRLHGAKTLSQMDAYLLDQNSRGAGIFLLVNESDGRGRKTENIVGLRALFVDDDDNKVSVDGSEFAAAPPSITVKTRRGVHHYWLLKPGEPVDRFTGAQQALAERFGTDPAVCDRTRVMRVPGFLHMKDPQDPFRVQLVKATDVRYTVDEVLKAFGLSAPEAPKRRATSLKPCHKAPAAASVTSGGTTRVLNTFRKLAIVRWATAHPDDLTREAWRGLATNLAWLVLLTPDAHGPAEQLFHELSCEYDGYNERETARVFADALRSAESHGPMRYETLMANGVPEALCRAPGCRSPAEVVLRALRTNRRG